MTDINKVLQTKKTLKEELKQQAKAREEIAKSIEAKNTTDAVFSAQDDYSDAEELHFTATGESESKAPGSSVDSDENTKQLNQNAKHVFIDINRLEERGFVALNEKRTHINEEYRGIKRKLLNNAFGALSNTMERGNLIVVTSARPNEGKTFNAINLALSIALEKDKTVLFVDADVLKPSVSNELEINPQEGLIEYLSGEVNDVSDIIYQTNIDTLRIIPAGKTHHLSNELLASERMVQLVEEFSTRYPDRVVVFDAPPLLGVNETTILAELSGQAVIVVESNKSKLAEVREAVSLLPENLAVGFVMNKALDTSDRGYGYYYGYGQE
ncbi:polysaccharide biosynthesis tyrosine autokinase [Catenovulum sp. SM1970]|uniref:XrtA-associated tyrosine autokinase n=1 Tax=Marinifaba aquimaris TaxID=2741323 RepID=UPI001573B077|nr:XrtA-associated tyrosine autokinase [Marinifaba aquimaris]NTS75960.1 polysaccharide biosynthesis tyrosine autokinase [Marinifaba aquimaris]